jgi:hypothetical protein
MESVHIKKTDLSPKVVLDKDNSNFFITGKSIVENSHEFYRPIIEWFKSYFEDPNDSTELIFYLEYINSSSFLQIANIVDVFSKNIEGNNLNIKWLYDVGDDTMKEIGDDLQYTYLVKFNFIELTDNNREEFNFSL